MPFDLTYTKQILDSTSECMFICSSLDKQILYANAIAIELYGYSPKELTQYSFEDLQKESFIINNSSNIFAYSKKDSSTFRAATQVKLLDKEHLLIVVTPIQEALKEQSYKDLYFKIKEVHQLTTQVDNLATSKIGQDYFETIVKALSLTLKADYCFIAQTDPNITNSQTLFLAQDGKLVDNITYELSDTPCQDVFDAQICIYPKNIQKLFPKDKLLIEMNIQAYAGVPIMTRDNKKQPPWILVALFSESLQFKDYYEHILALFAQKIRAERERQALLESVKAQKNKYLQLSESMRDGICVSDPDRNIIHYNQALPKIIGYNEEEMATLSIPNIIHPKHKAASKAQFAILIEKGHYENYETQIINKKGESLWIQVSATTIYDNDGNYIGSHDIVRDITNQKLREQAFHESVLLTKELEYTANLGIFKWDTHTKTVELSENLYKILEILPESPALSYESVLHFIHPKDKAIFVKKARAFLTNQAPFILQYRLITTTGKQLFAETVGYNGGLEDGIILGSVRDITEQRKAELELAKTREMLQETSQVARVGGWEVDLINNKYSWSTVTKEIHGLSPDFDLSLINLKDFVREDFRSITRAATQKTIQTGKPYELEIPIITTDKKQKWVQTIGKAEFKEGKCIRLYGTLQDITKRKQLEDKLSKTNDAEFARLYHQQKVITNQLELKSKELNRFFALSKDMISIFTIDTIPVRLNPAFIRFLEGGKENINATPLLEYIHPNDLKKFKNFIRHTMDGVVTTDLEHRFRSHNNTYRWLSWNAVFDVDNQVFYAIARDITDHKQLEIDLLSAKEDALRHAQIKEDFLANMSHEIRTPMNAILGFSRLLLQTTLENQQIDYAHAIYSSAENLLVIINDVLDFSKIESGKLNIDTINFELKPCINAATRILMPSIDKKNIDLIVEIAPNIAPVIVGASNRINQILLNLLSNAIKFTSQGYIKLSVSLVNDQDLRFQIQDTGIGIPPDKLDSIFESFTQAENYTTRVYGGTGLGLSISKKLVQMMGGQISVCSTVNKGSTFTFTIPYIEGSCLKITH